MDLKFSKKIEPRKGMCRNYTFCCGDIFNTVKKSVTKSTVNTFNPAWNYVLLFLVFSFLVGVLIFDLIDLQIVNGSEMLSKSENNKVRIQSTPAFRGVILDRNGQLLAKNVASMNVYILIENYLDNKGKINEELLRRSTDTLGGILKGDWKKAKKGNEKEEYSSIFEKVVSVHRESPYFREILIATDIGDDIAIKVKARSDELPGVYVDNGSKREYPDANIVSQILGYTGEVTADDLLRLDYVTSTDVIGRTGLEKEYNKQLLGDHGRVAWDIDAVGKSISSEGYIIKEPTAGKNLYLTIDVNAQKKMYSLLEEAIPKYSANAGAGIIEDVENGDILTMAVFPSYDNNLFVKGISQTDYNSLLSDKRNPLLNRALAAQVPPGSTFKTLVAASALDAGVINKETTYLSRAGYTFSSGARFQEYHNNSYGVLNLIDAISVSSNIYFCEVIRKWDMNALVPYLEKFGIGKYTKIDIPGEVSGRVPSPANKVALANTSSPWLEPVWYPEGDSCNSVIGQGITLVTPIQMVNWTSAIANGGTLNTPHVAKYFESADRRREDVKFGPLGTNVVSSEALSTVREAMHMAVSGPRGTIRGLSSLPVKVGAKTGTAEFGKLNSKGQYEHTHAWVTLFFPYEKPKYAMTIFLEDGGQSYNAVNVAREMILWMVENKLI